ncbi:MAG: COP9 signalosome complex subunit 1 [Lasallia pustulata]|uniref:COP9 signalosome complex subunit 1 n=1 Tax=Lasallia pustulata TaxID=136370 RepID=A0A5M8Q2Q3_9LECA|nr:MAG: COP9 signalosome complex subunit 1 [Lasallia pustulata]
MAGSNEPDSFVQARQQGRLVVKDAPKFDLDVYIANYKGKTRFDRLYLIGSTSSFLHLEALKGAIAEAKRGKDISRYEIAVATLREIAPTDPDATPDLGWIERMNKQVKAETDRLELELKGYKNNLIKESIRMGYDDLGQHYHSIGDLPASTKSYARMRDYCTTTSHIAIMCFRIIHVSIDQANWLAVQSNVQKIRNLNQKSADVEKQQAKLHAATGLACLALGHYRDAAVSFLATDPRMITAKLDDPSDDDAYNEIITPNDIAVYGGLCALASMNRNDLQKLVLENSNFRNYLELEPHIRRAISFFVSSKYSSCLSILESYKTDYLLDLHLQPHIPDLYFQVRSKSIIQYFIPFSSVTLKAIASAFATSEESIEGELVDMINRGTLEARIDLQERVLLAKQTDARGKVLDEALEMAKDYERTAHLRIMRMEILNAGLDVKAPKGQGLGSGIGQGYGNMGDVFMGPSGPQGRSGLRSGMRF